MLWKNQGVTRQPAGSTDLVPHCRRLALELLEDRHLLATFIVTSYANSGAGSLRDTVAQANATPGDDVVQFDPTLTLGLIQLRDQIVISDSVDIQGPGAFDLTIDAEFDTRIFRIDDGSFSTLIDVSISGITLANGNSIGQQEGYGGAIFSWENLTLTDSFVVNSSAEGFGGGIAVLDNSAGPTATIVNTVIARNSVVGEGGGVAAPGLTLIDSQVADNQAGLGGGVSTGGGGGRDALIEGSTIARNSAGEAGGISAHAATGGSVTITNSTIEANVAQSEDGGGAYLTNNGGAIFVTHSTFTRNFAEQQGGGIRAFETGVFVGHTIVAANDNRDGQSKDYSGPSGGGGQGFLASHSLVGNNLGSPLAEAPVGNPDLSGNLVGGPVFGDIDPRLSVLANFGGPTPVVSLLPDSPAINSGQLGVGGSWDQRGAPFDRTVGITDIGAYEYQDFGAAQQYVVDISVDETDRDYSTGNLSLREAIGLANANRGFVDIVTFDPALTGNDFLNRLRLRQGAIAIYDSISVIGSDTHILQGDVYYPNAPSRIFRIIDDHVVLIQGLELRSGIADNYGGAIFADGGELTIADTRIAGNGALDSGGGVYMADGQLSVIDSEIAFNQAGNLGGGIAGDAEISVSRSIISRNAAANRGGGIHAGGQLTIESTQIDYNGNSYGGVVNFGGGINIAITGTATVQNSTLAYNRAVSNGGGIQAEGPLTLINSTVSNNSAEVDGGGILAAGSAAMISIEHSTITQNTANAGVSGNGSGGGVFLFAGAALTLDHSIIAQNSDNSNEIAPDINNHNLAQLITSNYSLIGEATGTNLNPTPNGIADGSGNLVGPAFFQSAFLVEVDVAAMGDFEDASDVFQFDYRLDGGNWQPLFTSSVNEAGSQTYTLDSGTAVTLDDPLSLNGIVLNNEFQTVTATVPEADETLELRFSADTNTDAQGEAFAFRDLIVRSAATNLVFGRAASSNPSNDLFQSFVQLDPDYDIPGDMFGIRSRSNPNPIGCVSCAGLPFAIADDSLTIFPNDSQGIVGELDSGSFFGVVDTQNGNGNDGNTVVWQFVFEGDPINAGLDDLKNNGGLTSTHALQANSNAIDAGDAGFVTPPLNDQRDAPFARVAGARVDIGAYERQALAPVHFVVTTVLDEFDTSNAAISLREAVSAANGSVGDDTITFASETSGGTIQLVGTEIEIEETVWIDGSSLEVPITIDALERSRIFSLVATTDEDLTLTSLHLANGAVDDTGAGGAVLFSTYVEPGTLTLDRASISGGFAGSGGGIFAFGDVNVMRSQLSSNIAEDDDLSSGGGAMFVRGDVAVLDSTISGNTATKNGGGIRVTEGILTVTDSTLSDNVGRSGGALFAYDVEIHGGTISGNSAVFGGGGIGALGDVVLSQTTISGNSAGSVGGGIAALANLDTSDSTIAHNVSASHGGGVWWASRDTNDFLSVNQTTISMNISEGQGGGIFIDDQTVNSPQISHSTISHNTARSDVISRWDGESDALDTTGRHAGTLVGGVGFGAGQLGQAFNFDGLDDVVQIPNDVDDFGQKLRDGDFTLSLWARFDSVGGGSISQPEHILMAHDEGPGNVNKWVFGVGGEQLYFHINDPVNGPRFLFQEPFSASIGSWHHLAVRSEVLNNGNTIYSLYVDGSGVASVNEPQGTPGIPVIDAPLTLGGAEGFFMHGALDQVTIHDRALDGSLISGIHSSGGELPVFAGGGIHSNIANPITLDHSIVGQNLDGDDLAADLHGNVVATYGLVGSNFATDLTESQAPDPSGNLVGRAATMGGAGLIDPLLGALGANGGATSTRPLLPGSPAINAGDPSAIAGVMGVPSFDQRRTPFARIYDSRIDMGAFEVQPLPCDFEQDGVCELSDIDLLIPEIVAGTHNVSFDLTGDGLVDLADRDAWLATAGSLNLSSRGSYLLGDGNLDGVVDGQDFIVWNTNKFSSTGKWSQADWNADGITDGQDFLIWNVSKFQSSHMEMAELSERHEKQQEAGKMRNVRALDQTMRNLANEEPLRLPLIASRVDSVFATSHRIRGSVDKQESPGDLETLSIPSRFPKPMLD